MNPRLRFVEPIKTHDGIGGCVQNSMSPTNEKHVNEFDPAFPFHAVDSG